MKRIKILLFTFAATVIFTNFGFCQNYDGVNPEQPISVSENIYHESNMISTVQHIIHRGIPLDVDSMNMVSIKYIYLGVENNSIKLKKIFHDWNASEKVLGDDDGAEIISLPLNRKKQALLKVKLPTDRLKTVELIISVIDDFYRIKVEEFKGK
jgi:hypothetical protein